MYSKLEEIFGGALAICIVLGTPGLWLYGLVLAVQDKDTVLAVLSVAMPPVGMINGLVGLFNLIFG